MFLIPFLIIPIAAAPGFIRPTALRRTTIAAVAAVLAMNSTVMIAEELRHHESYADFVSRISRAVPENTESASAGEDRVLGPLTAEFALEYGQLLDWRNLAMLEQSSLKLADWIDKENIKYIIYTEELDVIFKNRPVWNLLYGNPTIYHEQLQDFIDKHCELVSEFKSPGYGTRIVLHRFKKDWAVRIYRIRPND